MAKLVLVSVSPAPLEAKTYTFLWTIDDISNGCLHKIHLDDTDAKVNLSKWYIKVALWSNGEAQKIDISRTDGAADFILTHIKVSIVNKKKEKLKIYEGNCAITEDKISIDIKKSLLSFEENGLLTDDKLTLMFEVNCINERKHNQAESSAGVSLQNSLNHLTSGFSQLFDSKQYSDVTLNVGDFTVKAHKAILVSSSPVFAAMFQHDMQEQKSNSITITDMLPEVLEEMLRFIYTGDIHNLVDMAGHLLAAADKYAIPNLKLKCEESLQTNICIESAAVTLMLADRYKAEHLKAKTLEYIAVNANKVMETQDWEEMIKIGTNIHLVREAFRAVALK